ncbi:MAG: hypothetical protein ACOY95_03330 [Pseudomonadota bacterium]
MALIIITLTDNDGDIDVGLQSEPSMGKGVQIPASAMTPAQLLATRMLNVAARAISQEREAKAKGQGNLLIVPPHH